MQIEHSVFYSTFYVKFNGLVVPFLTVPFKPILALHNYEFFKLLKLLEEGGKTILQVTRHMLRRQLLRHWYLSEDRVRLIGMIGFLVQGRVRIKLGLGLGIGSGFM